MPSFTVDNARQLSDYIIPLSLADATTITDDVIKYASPETSPTGAGTGYYAVYGPNMDGDYCSTALYVTPFQHEGNWYYAVVMDEYHPRKNGKADMVFGKHSRITGETAESLPVIK